MADQKLYELAGCIIKDEQNRILLLHRNTEAWQHWEIPGGKIEQNEGAADAAIREVREELGVDVRITGLISTKDFKEKDYIVRYSWFSAGIVSGTPQVTETDTFDGVRYFSQRELISEELLFSNGVKAFLGAQRYEQTI